MTYGQLKSLLVLVTFLVAAGIFAYRLYQLLWHNLRLGRSVPPFNRWSERTRSLALYVGGQFKLFRFLLPGTAHFFIFWGFIILSFTILQAILEGLLAFRDKPFTLPFIGSVGPLAFLQDLFAVLVLAAVSYGLYLRLGENPERYQGSHKRQGVIVLIFIATIMVSLLVMNGIRINHGEDPLVAWRPISAATGSLFANLAESVQYVVEEASYWIHLLVVFVFLTELPGGKHFHVVTSLPAVFLRNLEPPGRLPQPPETDGQPGVRAAEHFTWRQMLDFYTCTECGRCQEVCPAHASGLPLSPKILMMELRDNLMARGRTLHQSGNPHQDRAIAALSLAGDVISETALWSCSTCYACDQECPLFIEHIPPIVDLRRALVMDGRVDSELQDCLANLGRYGNSFGNSPRRRAAWTQSVQPKIKDARKEVVDALWFVGDYASYSPTLTEITQKTAAVFRAAGIDFGILYEGENNAGNDVRRVGEEGLYELLVEKNLAALEGSSYERIVTTDPHTFNTLKNEYPGNGHIRPVLHYAELLAELITAGKLAFSHPLAYRVTYHDPCYLGRYNGIYDAPRQVIRATGCELVEMPRNRDRAVCCGAGGGRIWMKEGELKERPSESRLREAVALNGVEVFVVACPKDVTMYLDAVKTTGHEKDILVKDLIELVYEAL